MVSNISVIMQAYSKIDSSKLMEENIKCTDMVFVAYNNIKKICLAAVINIPRYPA